MLYLHLQTPDDRVPYSRRFSEVDEAFLETGSTIGVVGRHISNGPTGVRTPDGASAEIWVLDPENGRSERSRTFLPFSPRKKVRRKGCRRWAGFPHQRASPGFRLSS